MLGGLRNVLNSDRDMAKSNWHFVKIDEIKSNDQSSIAIGPFGSRMTADLYRPSGVPVIRGTNISSAKSFEGDFVYISEETANDLKSCLVYPDDLVFPHRGAIGLVGIVPRDGYCKYILSSSLMKLSCNKKIADPYFLFYFFRSPIGKYELLKNSSTVGTPGIATPLTSLKNIELHIPPLPTQKAIAHILGTLDDKIELNRQMNETLESIAGAIFTSWFIDFDPVRAKADGKQPEGMDAATAALFPSEFETVEGQEIPKGWQVKPFIDIIEIFGGGTPKTSNPDYWNGNIPWFSVVDSPSVHDVWVIDTEKKITEDGLNNSSTRLLTVGTTIITARGTVGNLALVGNPMTMNQSCYGLKPKSDIGPYFSYYQIRSLIDELKQNTHGSVFDTITRDTFSHFSIIIPNKKICSKYEEITNLILGKMKQNLIESKNLSSIRDTLLPKLLSGELPITNPEQFTGVS